MNQGIWIEETTDWILEKFGASFASVDEITEAYEWVSNQSEHAFSCQESELLIRASHVSLLLPESVGRRIQY